MINYRKIWQEFYGPIPKDEKGRSYDIHHIDGNRHNNDISYLKAVSLEEHFKIHLEQGDYLAANMIADRLNFHRLFGWNVDEKTKEKISKSLTGKKRSKNSIEKQIETKRKNGNLSIKDETKEKIRNSLVGKKRSPHTEEAKKKISDGNKGKKRDNGRLGIKHTEEAKKKIGESNKIAQKGIPKSIEFREKISKAKKGKPGHKHSKESIEKIKASKKGKPWTEARRLAQKNKKYE